jgi:hypothetical protein
MKKLLGFFALAVCTTILLGAATVTVTKPATGDVWTQGQTYAVTWTKSGAMGNLVKVTLRDKNSAAELKLIADNVPNTGAYSWTIAAIIPNGQYRVRVKVKNEPTLGDSQVFNIGPQQSQASITVSKPAAGDSWQKTKPYTITWTKSGTMPNSVKIDLVDQNSAAVVRPIADNQPNTGSYPWTIPADAAFGPYRVRVQVKTTAIQADSGTFNIVSGLAPAGLTAMTKKVNIKTYTVPLNFVEHQMHRSATDSDYNAQFQARQHCRIQAANIQEYDATAEVGADHFKLLPNTAGWVDFAAIRARVVFDVTPFMGKGADIIEARMHLPQTGSIRSNTSNASCATSWWFLLGYIANTEAGWQNIPVDSSCHGDLHRWETDYSVDITPAVKRWVSGNQFNYGLLLISADESDVQKVYTCYSCYKPELIIKLKVE